MGRHVRAPGLNLVAPAEEPGPYTAALCCPLHPPGTNRTKGLLGTTCPPKTRWGSGALHRAL